MDGYTSVGREADFEAKRLYPLSIDGHDIALVRLDDGLHAFDNFCTHEALSFTSGYGVVAKGRVICMVHSSAFDIATGAVLTGPADCDLQTYDVRVQDGEVFVKA